MNTIHDFLSKHRIFTIIRIEDYDLAKECSRISIEGGLRVFEVSSIVPQWENLVKELKQDESILVGATLLSGEKDIEKACDASAQFVSIPQSNAQLIKKAKEAGLFVIAEAMTPTEILNAHNAGADMVGLFPVESAGGAKNVKLILENFPFLKIRARGGLNIYNFVDMLDAGASTVGISRGVFEEKALRKKDFDSVRKRVNLFMGRYRMWESLHTQ